MKAFKESFRSSLLRVAKIGLTKPVRYALLRIPFLPRRAARALDDVPPV
jgi:hypothetical protein